MNIFGVGLPEVTVILILALLIFGPKKLPELGKQLGKTLKSLKKASNEFQNEIDQVMNKEEKEEIPKTLENLRNVILEDVRKNGWLLKDVDNKFKSDREILISH